MSNKARRRERQPRDRDNDRVETDKSPLKLLKQEPEKQLKRHWKIPEKDWSTPLPDLKPRMCLSKHSRDIDCPACSGYPED